MNINIHKLNDIKNGVKMMRIYHYPFLNNISLHARIAFGASVRVIYVGSPENFSNAC
jgi:hypothetical protein